MSPTRTHGPPGMLEAEWETHRPAVFGVAYRLLGSVADAEDVAQDVWLRAAGADLRGIGDLRAWLVTVAARRSYDILKSARARRETYVGPWLPAPLLTGPDASEPVLVDESVGSAMLLVMEELTPSERVAFILHDVFGLRFDRIADVLDATAPAARQLASRARRKVAKARPSTRQASRAERERLLAAFRAAYEAGDLEGLVRLLHPEAVYVTDGGGRTSTARKFVHGGARVAQLMVGVRLRWPPDRIDLVEVGGEPGLLHRRAGQVFSVDTVEIEDGLITAYRRVLNPEKIAHVRAGARTRRNLAVHDGGPATRLTDEPQDDTGRHQEGSPMTEQQRVNIGKQHPANYQALLALSATVEESATAAGLDPLLVELLKIRTSQINGCAFCLRVHTRDALKKGENPDRIAVLPAWRETGYFSATDRAALRLTEAITQVSDGHVADAQYEAAADVLTQDQVSAVAWLATLMNAFNRVAVTSRYRVGG